jgi:hypothetical protein
MFSITYIYILYTEKLYLLTPYKSGWQKTDPNKRVCNRDAEN